MQANKSKKAVPESFICPITSEIMLDPVIVTSSGQTYERSAIVTWLKTNNTDPITRNPASLFEIVPNRALRNAIEAWLKKNPQGDEKTFYNACVEGDIDTVKLQLGLGVDVNYKENTNPPLLAAAHQKRLAIVKLLSTQPTININATNSSGDSVLLVAASNGDVELVNFLLTCAYVDVNLKNNRGKTVLIGACCNEVDSQIIKALLACPIVNVNLQDDEGYTPLIWTIITRNILAAKMLISNSCIEINLADKNKRSALYHAVARNFSEAIEALLAHPDMEIDAKDGEGMTALMLASNKGYANIVQLLIEHGADIAEVNNQSKTVFDLAANDELKIHIQIWHRHYKKRLRELPLHLQTAQVQLKNMVAQGYGLFRSSLNQVANLYPDTIKLNWHIAKASAFAVLSNSEIVTAADDKTLKIWDIQTGEHLRTLNGYCSNVQCIIVDGAAIITGGDCLSIWDKYFGHPKIFLGHTDTINCLDKLSEGKIISGSADKTLKVWDIKSGKCLKTLHGHQTPVESLIILPNDKAASISQDAVIKIWDLQKGECIKTSQEASKAKARIGCSTPPLLGLTSKAELISIQESHLKVWNVQSGECLKVLEVGAGIASMVALPNGQIVTIAFDGHIKIWDILMGQCVKEIQQVVEAFRSFFSCRKPPISSSLLPNGRLISCNMGSNFKIWDITTGQCISTLGWSVRCSLYLEKEKAVLLGSHCGELCLWDIKQQACIKTLQGHTTSTKSLTLLPDGRVISLSTEGIAKVWNIQLGKCDITFNAHKDNSKALRIIGVLPCGQLLSDHPAGVLKIWDIVTGQCLKTMKVEGDITSVEILSNDKIAIGIINNTLLKLIIWDIEHQKPLATLEQQEGASPWSLYFLISLPNKMLLSRPLFDEKSKIWDIQTGLCQCSIEERKDVKCVMALTNGKIVSSNHENTLNVWDIQTGECLQTIHNNHADNATIENLVMIDNATLASFSSYQVRFWHINQQGLLVKPSENLKEKAQQLVNEADEMAKRYECKTM